MILSHEPYVLPAMLDGSLNPMGQGRLGMGPRDVHLSQIVHRMMVEAGSNVGTPEGEQDGLRAQIGFLWERAIEYAWREYQQMTRPVEHGVQLMLDGLWMSPDGVNRADDMIEEYKFTWKSRRKWDEAAEVEFWHWMVQVKGYAHALGFRRARFLVFWAGGSYFKGNLPQIGPWQTVMEWTQAELDDNWQTVLRYKDVILRERA